MLAPGEGDAFGARVRQWTSSVDAWSWQEKERKRRKKKKAMIASAVRELRAAVVLLRQIVSIPLSFLLPFLT